MVDFRKTLLLLGIILAVGSLVTVQAQTGAPFSCQASSVNPLVRAEGMAELVGDVVLRCTGGNPTPQGTPVPEINFEIQLNVHVTSWLIDGPENEALILIDDPAPGSFSTCLYAEDCSIVGVGGEPGINYAAPGATSNQGNDVRNVYQGGFLSPNAVEWLGVPVDPPGTQFTRTIRITNVRGNANQLGVSGTLIPSQITMFISTTTTTSINIDNQTQTVAQVRDGLTFSTTSNSFLQCEDEPEDLVCSADFYLKYTENFPTAFMKKIGDGSSDPGEDLVETGLFTETGFYAPAANPAGIGLDAGYASQGTRLHAAFANVPAGVTLRVSTFQVDNSGSVLVPTFGTPAMNCETCCSNGSSTESTNRARLASANSVGEGGTLSGSSGWATVSLDSSGSGTATWEVIGVDIDGGLDEDPDRRDDIYFAVDVVYDANTTSGIPGLGTATVNGSYAPLSGVVVASSTAPRPRFFDNSTAEDIFTINSCATNLLWPYVTNQAGFDTGLVISNTSEDPFGTATQEGACTIYYYGHTAGGGAAPAPDTTPTVPAGEHAIWTLSSGGTVQTSGGTILPAQTFQGYVIASCEFQMAHGYAFISDLGASRLAQGYLALVMDEQFSLFPRTGSQSEVLGN